MMLLKPLIWGIVVGSGTTLASQLFTPEIAPPDISEGCLAALTADVACSRLVARFRYGYFYSASTLNSTCSAECEKALRAYEASVVDACAEDTWAGYEDEGDAPVAWIPSVLNYQYSLTCLQDSGRWCNLVMGDAAAFADPGDGPLWYNDASGNGTEGDPCDLCAVLALRIQASVPYFEGPRIVSQSLYQSKTSSCSIKDLPMTTSSLPFSISDLPAPTPEPCAGTKYQIKPGDDCHSISLNEGISTGWLLTDNQLPAWCNDFPTEGELCLVNTCSVVTVEANATCGEIAGAGNATEVLLKAWNPILDAGCYNLEKMVGDQLCISPPGDEYEDPPEVTLAPTTASTPAPVPTDIANGTNQRCGRYHLVEKDEYCNQLVVKFGISLDDFFFLNPALYQNCTNLFAQESYCIQAVGDINTYPGRPGWRPTVTTSVPFTSAIPEAPPSTTSAIVDLPSQLPLDPDTRTDCYRYFKGADYQDASVLEGTSWINQCQRVADVYGVSWDDFVLWNGGLGNISTTECAFDPDRRYCGKQYVGEAPEEPDLPTYEYPIREGAIDSCTEYADVPDDWGCDDVFSLYELTKAQFYEYNPEVGPDCNNLWPEMAYCIRAPGYTSPNPTSPGPTTTSVGPPAPTHTGQPANCNKWHVVEDGDSCGSVAAEYGITTDQFFKWNPAVSKDCVTNFWLGQAYCVGVGDSTPGPEPTDPPGDDDDDDVPSPVQEGNAVEACNKYAQAQKDDFCGVFAERNDVSLQQLYTWNRVLKSDGSGCATSFWSGYWYCVGVKVEARVRPTSS